MSRFAALAIAGVCMALSPVSAATTGFLSLEGRVGNVPYFNYWNGGGYSSSTSLVAMGIHPGEWVSFFLGYGYVTTRGTQTQSTVSDLDYQETGASLEIHFLRREHVRLSGVASGGMSFREYNAGQFMGPERYYWHVQPYLDLGVQPEYLFNPNLGVYTTVGVRRQWSPSTRQFDQTTNAVVKLKDGFVSMSTFGGGAGLRIYF